MRLQNKYKQFFQLKGSLPRIPQRLLKFRRPKWLKIQKKISLLNKKSISFSNSLLIKNSYKYWDKVNNYYKDGIQLKKFVLSSFDNSLNIAFFKKEILNKKNTFSKDILVNCLIKPKFRIDILLWNLNFFSSVFQARQAINEGEILINSKKVLGNTFLQKGDVIQFFTKKLEKKNNLTNTLTKNLLNDNIYPFVEIDFYTKTIIVLKNIEELTLDDLNILSPEYFDIKKFKNYL